MDLNAIKYKSIDATLKGIAERLKARRLEKNLSQKDFAKRAGVGYDAYLRFEKTGEISLRNLVLCAVALDDSEMFNALFNKQSYSSIDEILAEKKQAKRQRASRK
jgi:transcriptional regulator with XRE-family HTH domain